MEKIAANSETNTPKTANYYTIIQKSLKKQYAGLDATAAGTLCREVVFAPREYTTRVNGENMPVAAVRESLAGFIERDNAGKNFIPYSLDAEIADLMKKTTVKLPP